MVLVNGVEGIGILALSWQQPALKSAKKARSLSLSLSLSLPPCHSGTGWSSSVPNFNPRAPWQVGGRQRSTVNLQRCLRTSSRISGAVLWQNSACLHAVKLLYLGRRWLKKQELKEMTPWFAGRAEESKVERCASSDVARFHRQHLEIARRGQVGGEAPSLRPRQCSGTGLQRALPGHGQHQEPRGRQEHGRSEL